MQELRHLSRRFFCEYGRRFVSQSAQDSLPLNKVLLLKRRTRYELEKLNHADLSKDEFYGFLLKKGTNADALIQTYKLHETLSEELQIAFQNAGFTVNVIDRTQYTPDAIDWADLVVTAGGDGTFLVAASEIKTRDKPLVGFNTNPHQSTGYLCLPHSINYENAASLIRKYEFQWRFRTRIEVKLTGQFTSNDPDVIGMPIPKRDIAWKRKPSDLSKLRKSTVRTSTYEQRTVVDPSTPITSMILPSKALNEVFVAEKLPTQVTNLIVNVPGVPKTHVKCSGVCVSTGTGSTSWHMSMNRISLSQAHRLFKLSNINVSSDQLLKIIAQINDSLQFPYDDPRMFYTVRDLIYSHITPCPIGLPAEAFTQSISLTSKCLAADVVIDGTHAWAFNDGTIADLSTRPEIALRTIHLPCS